ncbi:fatty acyl-CoA hydrolase precursor, medium chain isoform X1 [Microcaecilia unicolor]|uniref:Carboxylic ester hydrolase n=1 Tax=Microcaecilia unicolor TaxID=1415580 RepID=A0A6P7Y5P4_9AMPH|nr:fatty acyl-CoA hydrolase precursor, medium chain-like isoform X1 [Microcaecilia unicolor]XP_030060312.1 fatty acyl-CoA hydrolase precursor, medium chain-like isoform X1 [Microcaecilia unicolor]XP_030060313.1 fatty acyl-CoA hydrolase precursor, medium chain-like isoform X1 [Microcaecilia unicolor]
MAASARGLLLVCLISDIWFTTFSATGQKVSQPTVVTKYGKVQGKLLSVNGTDRRVEAYLGIPFAKPPVGPLRFSPPQPAEPWNGVRNATSDPPMCLQKMDIMDLLKEFTKADFPTFTVSEDCLFLNIYTPAHRKKKSKLPVMVWIHGGGLTSGGASIYDGSVLSAYENVVMVPIQYRLGLLGFFSTGEEHALGNWGFLDQLAALRWIQENIEDFGGDPDSVTIFGESAGGISVSALILSPLSKGLFHKAISESGVATFPGIIMSDPVVIAEFANMTANLLGCEGMDSAAAVNCLRTKTEEELLDPNFITKVPFIPAVVEGVFLSKSPEEFLPGEEGSPVPYLLGFNNHEFGWIIPNIAQAHELLQGKIKENIMSSLEGALPFTGPYREYFDLAREEYLGDTEDPIQLRDLVLEMFGDMMFVIPSVKTARYHRDSGLPVFLYEFQHQPSGFGDLRPDFVKADHGDELSYVLGNPFQPTHLSVLNIATDEEKSLSRAMMKYWANFARTGNPNGDGLVEWPVYDHNEQYLEIDLQQKAGTKLKDHRVTFWTKIVPEKIQQRIKEKKEHTEL